MNKTISMELIAQNRQVKSEKNYWLNKLSGELVKTYFPYDNNAAYTVKCQYDYTPFEIPGDIVFKMVRLSRGDDNNLYIILLTCLAILLNKYTDNKDIVLTAPIYKQDIDGYLINTALLLRLGLTGEESIKDLILMYKETLFEANEHLNYPIERLVDELDVTSSQGGFSLFEIGILLENIHYKKYIEYLNPNVLLSFKKTGENIGGTIEYNSGLYKKETIERIVAHFIYLLGKILDNSNLRVSGIEIITEEEKKRLLTAFNETTGDYPGDRTIHELFEAQVEKNGENIAVVGEEGYTIPLKYEDLNKRSNQSARILRNKGVKPGTIVGVMVSSTPQTLIGILAVLKAGGAYLPIDPEFPPERINYMLKDSQTHCLLIQHPAEEQLTAASDCIHIDSDILHHEDGENLENISSSEDIVYVIYTSGTSGRPKGVLIKNENLVNYCSWFAGKNSVTAGDKALLMTSFAFDLGYSSIYPPLLCGGELHILPKEILLTPDKLMDYIKKKGITYLKLTPSLFSIIVNSSYFTSENSSSLRLVLLGGEPINTGDVAQAHRECNNLQIVNHYGPTETTIGSIARVIDSHRFEEYRQNPTIGKPITNTKIYILDWSLKPVPIGIPAELFIGGKGVGKGYLNRPELTNYKFILHPFGGETRIYRSGDLARWTIDGNIEFIGRIDTQVKIRGFRIELEEIENQLLKLDAVKNVVVTAREDINGGRYLCAYYAAAEPIETTWLKEYTASKLPAYMVPAFFVFIGKIPVTANGKVDLSALPEPVPGNETSRKPPKNEQQKKLASLWAGVLGIAKENISIEANFFELGGDSLKATTLITKIHKEFNIQVPLLEFFKSPSIEGVSEIIDGLVEGKYTSISPTEEKEYYPLSSVQKRIHILQQIEDQNTSYNVPSLLTIEGEIDLNRLNNALKKLLSRHQILRTSFEMIKDEPIQRVHQDVEFELQYDDRSSLGPEWQETMQDFMRPFDLSKPPLLRAGIIKKAEMEYIFWVDMHHIVRDGNSANILNNEFMALYAGDQLPRLRLQYKDYSEWQHSQWMQEKLDRQEQYWLQNFSGEIPVLDLPTDFPRPAIQSYEGNTIHFELEERETTALSLAAKARGTTLFMILLAIFKVFLSKITGQKDVVIGIPIAARTHADLEKIIGMFVNTLVLRNIIPDEGTFAEFLNGVKEKTLQAYDNQDYTFEELVEKASVERDLSRNPIFDVMFVLQNISDDPEYAPHKKIENLTMKFYPYEIKTSKFDLTLTAIEGMKKISFGLQYCTHLFKSETIHRFIKYFKTIAVMVLENPERKISGIEILTSEDKKQVLYTFNDTKTKDPAEKTLHDLFEEQVERTPNSVALKGNRSTREKSYNISHMSYKELNEKSNRLSCLLKEKLVHPDTIIGIMTPRSLEMMAGILGVLRAGGAYLPIDPDYPPDRIAYMLKDSKAKILLVSPATQDKVKAEEGFIEEINISNIFSFSSPSLTTSRIRPVNLAYVIYTSGSTGKPKGVMIEHQAVANFIKGITDIITVDERSIVFSLTTISFDIFGLETILPLTRGSEVFIGSADEQVNPEAAARVIKQENVTILQVTPSRLSILLSDEKSNSALKYLKNLLVGGEAFPEKLLVKARVTVTGRIYNMYGPTETTIWSTLKDVTKGELNIGKPIANTRIYIKSQSGNPQPVGLTGELCISGEGLARGYINQSELTFKKFIFDPYLNGEHMYRTGDKARWLPDGNIQFLGRMDNQVKIRGYRIELGEIENLLARHSLVKETVVIARESNNGDTYLCAYYVPTHETQKIETRDIEDFRQFLLLSLPEYMIPSYFVSIKSIPLSSNGKVDRKALPEPEINKGSNYVPPRDALEEKLVNAWAEALGIEKSIISIDSDFFKLGGHSLKAATLVSRVHNELNVKLPLAEVFKNKTVRTMSEYILKSGKNNVPTMEPIEKKEYYDVSFGQRRVWLLSQSQESSLTFNMRGSYFFKEEVKIDLLNKTFEILIERHESLRTIFFLLHEEIKQKVLAPGERKFQVDYKDLRTVENGENIAKDLMIEENNICFDLQKGPLLRAKLIQLQSKEFLLLYTMHHIVSDYLSVGLLRKEFLQLYQSLEGGVNNPLKPLKIQYKDFVAWQNGQLQGRYLQKLRRYWQERFNDKIPVLNLPYDNERPKFQSYNGETIEFSIPEYTTGKLRTIALDNDATLFMVLIASVNILLSFYSAQNDIIIGIPASGREHPALENQIGFYLNTLALRTKFQEEETFTQFLASIKKVALEAYEHQMYPFDQLIDELHIKREFGSHPLFDVIVDMLNLNEPQNLVGDSPKESTIPLRVDENDEYSLTIHQKRAKNDLVIYLFEEVKKITIFFEYNTDLFERKTITRMVRRYRKILEDITATPDKYVSTFLLEKEIHPVLFSKVTGNSNSQLEVSNREIIEDNEREIKASNHQTRVWFIDSFEAGKLYESNPIYHNIPLILRLKGEILREIMEKSIKAVIHRHEALRTRIITKDSQPWQKIEREIPFKLEYLHVTENMGENKNQHAMKIAVEFAKQPFQLDGDSLIRAKMIQISGNECLVVIAIHHIISDRYSLTIISNEIIENYQAIQKGETPNLSILSSRYVDFSKWQLGLTEELLEPIIFYWKRKLKPPLQPLQLPTDRPRAAIHIYHEGSQTFEINGTLLENIETFCQQNKIGKSSIFLAVFKILLAKYSAQEEILVGIVHENRNQPGLEQVVGPISNLLVLRNFLYETDTFLKVVKDIEKNVREAQKYKDIPFEELDQQLKPPKDMSRTVFFDVLFQYESKPKITTLPGNIDMEILETNLGYGKYDLNLFLRDDIDAVSGYLVYNRDYYNESSITRYIDHYILLLENCVENRNEKVFNLNFLTKKEKNQLLFDINGADVGYPREKTLYQLFAQQVAKRYDNIALVGSYKDKQSASEVVDSFLSYTELDKQSSLLAAKLRKKGVGPDIIVAIKMGRSIEAIIAIMGVLHAGGAYLPVDPFYPSPHTLFMVKDSGAKFMIDDNLKIAAINTAGAPSVAPRTDFAQPHHLAYVIYTSGTTGKHKGMLIEHRNVVRLMFNDSFQFDFNTTDTWTLFHSLCFDFSVWEMYGALLYGGKLIVISRMVARDTRNFKKLLQLQHVTVLNHTPSAFYRLMEEALKPDTSSLGLKYVIFGGEALNPGKLKEWHTRYPGTRLINMYGITETTVHVTYKEITAREIDLGFSNIGKPIPTLQTYVVDRQMNLVPIGIPGELCVGGNGVGRGYLNRPQLTAEKFIHNVPFLKDIKRKLYRSGDLVRLLENGEMLYLGRIDCQVKIRGHRIELGEIENQLLRFGPVKEAVVIDLQNKQGDKYLCAYVTLHASDSFYSHDSIRPELPAPSIGSSALRTFLVKRIPEYMLPSHFLILQRIPLTDNGKVDRKALPEPEINIGAEYIPPRNEMEKGIVFILSEIMEIAADKISIRANFFDIGINSVTLLKIAHRISKEFGIDLPLSALFNYPSVEELIENLKKGYKLSNPSRAVLLNRGKASRNMFVISGDGAVYTFKELAMLLEEHFNVYGIQAKGIMDTGKLPETREEIYESNLEEIRKVQPEGPYFLAGHCFGATIAYELARILEDQNETVDKVIHFDEPAIMTNEMMTFLPFYRLYNQMKKILKALKNPIECFKITLYKKTKKNMQTTQESNNLPEDMEARRLQIDKNYRRLFDNVGHFTRIINASILVIKADQPTMPKSVRWAPETIAKQSRSGVELVYTPGDHFSMFEAPYVTIVAKHMVERV